MSSFNNFYFNEKKKIKLNPGLLLHPNIPKPLHTVNPRSVLGRKWWDIHRQTSYADKDYHCHACGVHKEEAKFKKWLEGHEHYDINYKTGEVKFVKVVALCHSCHNYIHNGRMQALLEQGVITRIRFNQIQKHGELVLRLAGHKIFRPSYPAQSEDVRWDDWHMVIEGKKYYSPFKDYDAWIEYHRKLR